MQDKLTNVFISDGTDLKSNGTAFTTITDLGIVGGSMLNVAGSTTIAANPTLYMVNKLADGSFKRSVPMVGTHVTGYKGSSYKPSTRCVWAIGYHRASVALNVADGGSIEVNNDTLYSFDLHFTNDKSFYSERPEYLRVQFTSSSTATQSSIATQIANAINNSAFGSQPAGVKEVEAIVVNDGSGNYGVEVWGLNINQFRESSYVINKVNFSVQCDSSTGFGATTVAQLMTVDPGMGTYEEVYVAEKVGKRNEGVLNWTKFPVPTQDYLSSSAGFLSGINGTATVTGTTGQDTIAFSAAITAQLFAGSVIRVSGNFYEIKYFIDSTHAVLTSVLLTSPSTTDLYAKAWYDMITIELTDVTLQDGSGVSQTTKKIVTIALPAIDAGATNMTTASTITTSVLAVLNPWVTSAPLNAATLSL